MNLSVFNKEELIALSLHDLRAQNFQAALEKIKHILSVPGFPSQAYAVAGKIYDGLGLHVQARAAFLHFLEFNPDAYMELFEVAILERNIGNYDQAIQVFDKVLAIEPYYPDALFYAGDICFQLNRIDEAKKYLNLLVQTAPDGSEYAPMAEQMLRQLAVFS